MRRKERERLQRIHFREITGRTKSPGCSSPRSCPKRILSWTVGRHLCSLVPLPTTAGLGGGTPTAPSAGPWSSPSLSPIGTRASCLCASPGSRTPGPAPGARNHPPATPDSARRPAPPPREKDTRHQPILPGFGLLGWCQSPSFLSRGRGGSSLGERQQFVSDQRQKVSDRDT